MNNYRELKIWNDSVELSVEIYEKVNVFPKQELYGLSDQIKRSAVSIPSNIAEGAGRNSQLEFNRFLSIASGSAAELNTQLIIANKLKFFLNADFEVLQQKLEVLHKMIYKLKRAVQKSIDDEKSKKR